MACAGGGQLPVYAHGGADRCFLCVCVQCAEFPGLSQPYAQTLPPKGPLENSSESTPGICAGFPSASRPLLVEMNSWKETHAVPPCLPPAPYCRILQRSPRQGQAVCLQARLQRTQDLQNQRDGCTYGCLNGCRASLPQS